MHTRHVFTLVALSLACHDGSATAEPVPAEPAPILEQAEIVSLPGIALAHGLHRDDIVDIVLCPDASAALTLDLDGGVRLWPNLDGTSEPLIIPIDDPNSLSFARTQTGYVIATLDTIGGAEVYELRDHDGELRLDARFSIPPTDPLFELHVLDGGERLLALGVDHRIHLYDANGRELSSIAEHGFVPWQLRHVETDAGITLVAILAGPTRVQPLELRDDHLKIVGEPFPVELDRGPNRNDLVLTPDGEHIAAFSRRKWRSGEWQLQLLRLADHQATLIEGKSEGKERPRIHLLDGDRMLLDDGTGVGQLISLDPSAPSAPTTRPLPGSSERARLFTSIERGVRVVPNGKQFIVDRLDAEEHLEIGSERTPMRGAGLSPDGTRVVWAFADGWAVDSLDGTSTVQPTVHEHSKPLIFADFVDDTRVVLVSHSGRIDVVNPATGVVLASNDAMRNLTEVRLARGESPTLLVRDLGSKHDVLHTIGIDHVTAHMAVAAESEFIGPWYPSETPSTWTSMTWHRPGWWGEGSLSEQTLETELAIAIEHEAVNIRELATLADGGRVFVTWFGSQQLIRSRPNDVLRVGELEAKHVLPSASEAVRLAPSPTGALLAVVYRDGNVGMHDARTLDRQWTRVEGDTIALGWSADGARLVVAGERGGAVLEAATGELELERRDLGLHVERTKNLVAVPKADSIPTGQLPNQ